jgi:hypothetical protein
MIVTIIVVCIILLFCWASWSLNNLSQRTYSRLDEFWDRARKALTQEELRVIHVEFVKFSRKECVFRAYCQYAMKVDQYICGKYDGMNNTH